MNNQTIVKRINNTLPDFLGETKVKQSSAFIEDVRSQSNFLQNSFLRLNSVDAFRLYQFNEWVFGSVNRIAKDCSKVKPRVVPVDPSALVRPATQRRIDIVKRFLRKPNNNKETFRAMREKFVRDLLVFGHAAYEKVNDPDDINANGMRQLLEIHNLQAANMEINADRFGNLFETDTYRLREGNLLGTHRGNEILFDKDEVIFQVLIPVVGSLYGLKPLDSLANAVASDILRAAYNGNFFVNGSEATGIVSIEDGNRNDVKKFEEIWKSRFKGARNSHKMAVVNKKINWVRMALTNQDMQFQEYGIELRDKIFSVFGMQSIIMGVASTGSAQIREKQEAIDCYKSGALKPVLDIEAEAYTREIVNDGFGYEDIKISFEELDKLDLESQSRIDKQDLDSAVVTINEVRASRQLPPVKWGDTPVIVVPGGGQIDPDTGRLIPPRDQSGGNGGSNNNKFLPENLFKNIRGSAEIVKFNNLLRDYCNFLVSRQKSINVGNIEKVFNSFDIYHESRFRNLAEKALCYKLLSDTKNLFLAKKIRNIKIFAHYYDRISKGVMESHLYKDLEDYESVYSKNH